MPRRPIEAAQPQARRVAWIDVLRGIGILLVVFGHTLRGLFGAELLPETGAWARVDAFIYAFHMPLFFFVAGLFLWPSQNEGLRAFAKKRVLRLGYPYALWATLQTMLQCLLSRYTNHDLSFEDLWRIGIEPPLQFWFLYALLLQVLAIGLLCRLGVDRRTLPAIGLIAYATSPLIPLGSFMPLNQARDYLVYTTLGVFCGAWGHDTRHLPRTWLWACASAGYAGVALAVQRDALSLRWVALLAALYGGVASVCVALLIARRAQPLSWLLARWGEASMAIFVAHTLASAAMRIALARGLGVTSVVAHLSLGTVVGLTLPWALYALGKRYHFPYAFEWPLRTTPQPRTSTLTASPRVT